MLLKPTTPRDPDALRELVDSGLLRCGVPVHLGGAGEALLQSPNVALRELWLNDFLSGERAATVAPSFEALSAHDTGRGWLLRGELKPVPNLQWAGFSLVAPVRLNAPLDHWVLLRSEEDGLSVVPEPEAHWPEQAHAAALRLDNVFFREDEWLGGPDLPQRLAPVAAALAPGLPCPTDWNRNHLPTLSSTTFPTT